MSDVQQKNPLEGVNSSSVMRLRLKRTEDTLNNGFGFGFKIQDSGSPPALQIVSLVEGSEAEKSGLIRPGDIILTINNVSVDGCTYDEAIQTLALMPIGAYVSFVVRVPLGFATKLVTTFDDNGMPRTLRITERTPKPKSDRTTLPNTKVPTTSNHADSTESNGKQLNQPMATLKPVTNPINTHRKK